MKLKLIAPGFENFTGPIGVTPFENGISVNDVPPVHARRIAGVMSAVCVETGESPSVSASILLNKDTAASTDLNGAGIDPVASFSASTFDPELTNQQGGDEGEGEIINFGDGEPEEVPPAPDVAPTGQSDEDGAAEAVSGLYWTETELGEIADKKGIKGLREIAEPAGIKGNSVSGLIDQIVKKSIKK